MQPNPGWSVRRINPRPRGLEPDFGRNCKFNEKNEEHRQIRSGIEFGNGLTRMATVEEKREGQKEVGFEVLSEVNMAYRTALVP